MSSNFKGSCGYKLWFPVASTSRWILEKLVDNEERSLMSLDLTIVPDVEVFVESLLIDWFVLGDVGAQVEVVSDDVEVSGVQIDVLNVDFVALESVAVDYERSRELLERVTVGEMVHALVERYTVGQVRVKALDCDSKRKLLAGLGMLTEAGEFEGEIVLIDEVVVFEWTLNRALLDRDPAEIRRAAVV